jgi:uncharacterized protein with ParB-like and HNH nuclease domain
LLLFWELIKLPLPFRPITKSNHMENIDAKKKVLKDLLSRDHFYRVPEYQRPYSWDEEHFTDLIQDLLDANKDREYFLGTIVVHHKSGMNDIVDGQQRLTTILILMACLRDLLNSKDFKSDLQEKIMQKANKVDEIPKRIRIEVKDREAFNNIVVPLNGTNRILPAEFVTEPEWRYFKAIEVFKKALKNLSQTELENFTQFLSQNCVMVFLATTTFDDAFRLFTIVNDRGKQLRRIDILKANNISPTLIKSEPVRNSLAQKWEDAEKNLGGETFENMLFLLRLILIGEKPQNDLLVEFEDRVFKRSIVQKGEGFVDLVCEYATLYNDTFEDYTIFDSSPIKNRLIGLTYIMNSEFKSNEWKAPVLLYLQKFQLERIEEFLSFIELKFLEGWILNQTKDSRIVMFGNITKSLTLSKTVDDVFQAVKMDINRDKMLLGIEGDLYYKSYCKYILLRLELLSSENDVEKRFKAKSIEHILPQNPKKGSNWLKEFSGLEMLDWPHKLGNLVLLSKSKNSSASNFEFIEKKIKYLNPRVSDYPRSMEILRFKEWNSEVLAKRQKSLMKIVLNDIFEN